MRSVLQPVMLTLVPLRALAADGTAAQGGFSFMSSFLQMVASLAVVIGLIFLIQYATGRWFRKGMVAGQAPRHIRLVETRFMAPKKSLLLVEVGGEYLLLASSGEGLQFLKQIDMLEEIEVIGPATEPVGPLDGLRGRIRTLLAGFPRPTARVHTGMAPLEVRR